MLWNYYWLDYLNQRQYNRLCQEEKEFEGGGDDAPYTAECKGKVTTISLEHGCCAKMWGRSLRNNNQFANEHMSSLL